MLALGIGPGTRGTWSRKLPITATDSGLDSHLPVITAALCVCSACTWKVTVSSLLRLNMSGARGTRGVRARAVGCPARVLREAKRDVSESVDSSIIPSVNMCRGGVGTARGTWRGQGKAAEQARACSKSSS